MDDMWSELSKKSEEMLGVEKTEELNTASDVITELFGESADIAVLTMILGIASGISIETAMWSQFLTGCGIYREFMVESGVDVDVIEKKALEEKRKK